MRKSQWWITNTRLSLIAVCTDLPRAPRNGMVTCQKSRYPGSQCKYSCKRGYQLVGNTIATCTKLDDIAYWNGVAPVCRRLRMLKVWLLMHVQFTYLFCIMLAICDPIPPPKGGKVDCFGDGKVGTYCIFSCNERTQIEGASAVSCMTTDSGPAWSDEFPTCEGKVYTSRCDSSVSVYKCRGRHYCWGSKSLNLTSCA